MPDQISPSQAAHDQESRADADPAPQSSQFWLGEITAAQKRDRRWHERARKVVARFRDEREREHFGEKRANILWSNTEILKSALFSGLGNPDVRRRFPKRGADDKAARTAAIVLERGLSYCQDAYDAESPVECAIEDMLLPGRGVAWVVYEADVEDKADNESEGEEGEEAEGGAPAMMGHNGGPPMIHDQRVELQHVYWQDFLTSAGRKWADVWWVARRHVYSRDELIANFGEEHGSKIPLGAEIDGAESRRDGDRDDTFKRANVWEIWDRSKKQRIYVAEGYNVVIKADDDPYRLRAFFPCPEPLYGVKTTSALTPIPEYTLYQDQADELDQITTRLHNLVDALRRRGVYDASAEGPDNQLSQLQHARDNQFVPYKGFAVLMEKGGLKNVFQTEDLTPIVAVVDRLYTHRATLVQTIYEVTGISDVLRGSSNPNETATAQRIKGQFGSLRLQKRQSRVQRFIRDAYRLKAEIMAEHFTREKLVEMTGIEMPDRMEIAQAQAIMQQMQMAQQIARAGPGQMPGMQAPMPMQPPNPAMVKRAQEVLVAAPWDEVSAILRSDERRGYKIDVESDATAKVDDLEEKQARLEFITSMQGYLEKALPAAMQIPALLPLIREMTSFGVRAFKIGRSMEEAFDDAFDRLGQMAQQQQQAGPTPDPKAQAEAQKAQADAQRTQVETQAIQMRAQADVQATQQRSQADAFAAQQKAQAEATESRLKQEAAMLDLEERRRAGDIKAASAIADLQTKIASAMQPYGP